VTHNPAGDVPGANPEGIRALRAINSTNRTVIQNTDFRFPDSRFWNHLHTRRNQCPPDPIFGGAGTHRPQFRILHLVLPKLYRLRSASGGGRSRNRVL